MYMSSNKYMVTTRRNNRIPRQNLYPKCTNKGGREGEGRGGGGEGGGEFKGG